LSRLVGEKLASAPRAGHFAASGHRTEPIMSASTHLQDGGLPAGLQAEHGLQAAA